MWRIWVDGRGSINVLRLRVVEIITFFYFGGGHSAAAAKQEKETISRHF